MRRCRPVLYHPRIVDLTEIFVPMKIRKTQHVTALLGFTVGLTLLAGCASSPPAEPPAKQVNDFSTQARVEYVIQCMQEQGGENFDNMYHCVCSVDKIAASMSYEEFAQAQTFTFLFNTPGERGGEFRDPPQSAKLRTKLKEVKAEAAQACLLKPAKNK